MDDENSDFVLSPTASKVKHQETSECATLCGTAMALSVVPDTLVAPFKIDSFESHVPSRASASIPLRC
jgi:hypothetical protein